MVRLRDSGKEIGKGSEPQISRTTNTTSLNETDRLYLAFSEEDKITDEEMEGEDIDVIRHGVSDETLKFDKVGFLIGFANYGVTKICEQIDNNINVTMENISEFLIISYQGETPELREMRKWKIYWMKSSEFT